MTDTAGWIRTAFQVSCRSSRQRLRADRQATFVGRLGATPPMHPNRCHCVRHNRRRSERHRYVRTQGIASFGSNWTGRQFFDCPGPDNGFVLSSVERDIDGRGCTLHTNWTIPRVPLLVKYCPDRAIVQSAQFGSPRAFITVVPVYGCQSGVISGCLGNCARASGPLSGGDLGSCAQSLILEWLCRRHGMASSSKVGISAL